MSAHTFVKVWVRRSLIQGTSWEFGELQDWAWGVLGVNLGNLLVGLGAFWNPVAGEGVNFLKNLEYSKIFPE